MFVDEVTNHERAPLGARHRKPVRLLTEPEYLETNRFYKHLAPNGAWVGFSNIYLFKVIN